MEASLNARDRIGLQDFVLLEQYNSIEAFVENLKKRFKHNFIYTYIGQVLISVNPYKNIPNLYGETMIKTYRNVNFFELPPHIYAIADMAYRCMWRESTNQCVLISGESGSGKTEATKKILQYLSTIFSTNSQEAERVKTRLLQSTPLLEAFGNAKTSKNDNSSRFGKYMDIQFNFQAAPTGGIILNYLLEKCRVCKQMRGERNFHVFYQLLAGADDNTLSLLQLSRDVQQYHYLNQSSCCEVSSIDDKADYQCLLDALSACDFSSQQYQELFCIIAAILHLGNIGFKTESSRTVVTDEKATIIFAKLLGCDSNNLLKAITNRSIVVDYETLSTPLTNDQALYAKDALAKGIYQRLFDWLVHQINRSLVSETNDTRRTVLGLLDIYGFEILRTNSFEQFCINYCNEKLQQLFIMLTIKSEQEEYLSEGIEWEPVTYFNNRIICDLVENKQYGIFALMNEECLRPGTPTDKSFLDKMSTILKTHPHFFSHETVPAEQRKLIKQNEFRLLHYAGEVTYKIANFLDKNNDLLYRDMKSVMSKAKNSIISACFTDSDLSSKKMPETVSTQFKCSLGRLMTILASKQPSYIRCIKPNDSKRPSIFVEQMVEHQVKYLGLMENLRVRRAGFAYRRKYDIFLNRYKSLCKETWPHFDGPVKEGVRTLCTRLNYQNDQYRLGKTKVFIRFPDMLFAMEDGLQKRKHELVTMIIANYKRFVQRRRFLKQKAAASTISGVWRMFWAKRILAKRRQAAKIIRSFIKGYTMRNQPPCEQNRIYISHMRRLFLLRVRDHLPTSLLDKTWPAAPQLLTGTSTFLRKLFRLNLARKYCRRISAQWRMQLEQKVYAERLFRGKKQSYPASIKYPFLKSRLDVEAALLLADIFIKTTKPTDEDVKYVALVTKYDRNGYQPRARMLVMTGRAVYLLTNKTMKIKERIPLRAITGISTSNLTDNICVIHCAVQKNNAKGDLILRSDYVIESVTKIAMAAGLSEAVKVARGSIVHQITIGKQGIIDFRTGSNGSLAKGKRGHLTVVAPRHG